MRFNCIYQTKIGVQTNFELNFNENVLFKHTCHVNFFDGGQLNTIKNDSIIIYSSNKLKIDKAFTDYLIKFESFVLFHCSNESLNHFSNYYKYARAVLRSGGWNPNIVRKNVFSVPLAYQSEFYNPDTSSIILKDRKYAWCFFGSLKGDRTTMYNALSDVKPFFHFESKGWMQNENKTPVEVIEYYKNMIFIPSPKGNIYFECNRTMDALEWGCIPVSIKFLGEDCYKYLYGDHPFIIGDKWSDVAQQMKDLINNPKKLRLKQIEVFNWYQNFKKELADDISYIVNGEFKKIKGVQFAYQRRVKKNIWLRWRFFKHFTLSVYWKRIIGQTPVSKQ